MNKIILSVGADDRYLQNIHLKNYIDSIIQNSNFDENILVYLGENEISSNTDRLKIFNVKPESILKKNYNNCIQHGEFLNTDEFNVFSDSDVIVFTDGDITLQRNLFDDEKELFGNLKDNDVFVGYNESPTDTLKNEYLRLSPYNVEYDKYFDEDLNKIKIYNTGVLAMNKKTWVKLKEFYINKFDFIDSMFKHYAKQQWLISYIIGTEDFNVIEMGYDIHNHTHYPPPVGTTINDGIVRYNNKVVLFKHKWF